MKLIQKKLIEDPVSKSAEIAFRIFETEQYFNGLFSCGGDITVSVCRWFGVGGRNINLVSKGGMVGDDKAIM